ncbi:carbohydrate kinase family protein [Luteococcus sp. OSA5]|uniref:carbohydrate kinase family protein n=1 Tax=Luteococcus sp. OSA5 TaxID=3401630 RepID=UPI003B4283FD
MINADYDLLACGLFFNDLAFSGLPAGGPVAGHELRTGPYEQSPGGIANSSIAARRLGLDTCMVTDCGDDPMTTGALTALADEGIDTCHVLVHEGWQTPLTVILNYDGDRAMVTSETAHPGPCVMRARHAPSARVAITHLQPFPMPWLAEATARGTQVIGDIGWDESGRWNLADLPDLERCTVFTPNEVEAVNYTRTENTGQALAALAEIVPMPVVTLGPRGCISIDARTGEQARVPALGVDVVDTCGAGDVFSAGLAAVLTTDWPLADKLRFATLVSTVTVSRLGGATTAPDIREMQGWVRDMPRDEQRDYGFVLDLPLSMAGGEA